MVPILHHPVRTVAKWRGISTISKGAEVCKTFIQRFESAPRLHSNGSQLIETAIVAIHPPGTLNEKRPVHSRPRKSMHLHAGLRFVLTPIGTHFSHASPLPPEARLSPAVGR